MTRPKTSSMCTDCGNLSTLSKIGKGEERQFLCKWCLIMDSRMYRPNFKSREERDVNARRFWKTYQGLVEELEREDIDYKTWVLFIQMALMRSDPETQLEYEITRLTDIWALEYHDVFDRDDKERCREAVRPLLMEMFEKIRRMEFERPSEN